MKKTFKARKIFAIFILVLLLIISSSNYYGIKGIDNLAYVVAIGLDVGDTREFKFKSSNICSQYSSE